MSLLSKLLVIASVPAWAACTSMTAGTTGVTDLVCDGRDLINSAPVKWLVTYYRTAPGTIVTSGQIVGHTTAYADLGGGVYQQTYYQAGVPFLKVRYTPSITANKLVFAIEVENISSDVICPIMDTVIINWSGSVTTDAGYTRPRYQPGTSLPIRTYSDSQTSMALVWDSSKESSTLKLGYFGAVANTNMRWGTYDGTGNGYCVNPGVTTQETISHRFGATGENAVTLAADIVEQYRADYKNTLADRRSIGAVFLSSSASRTTNNPRGWILTTDLNNPNYATKLAAFNTSLQTMAGTIVSKLQGANAQGVIIWDIEGQEIDHATSYICDPRMTETLAPEMAGSVDQFFGTIRSAGFKVGHCIRPTEVLAQVGPVTEACTFEPGTAPGTQVKLGMEATVPYAATPYYCRADGFYHPRDTTVSSVDVSANTITLAGDYFFDTDRIGFYSTGGSVPGGITLNAIYYVVNRSSGAFQISLTSGGAAIDITSSGSGVITATASRDQHNLQYAAALQSMVDKVTYARSRWGSTLFYIDTIFVQGYGEMPSKLARDLAALFPDCAFFPEILGGGEGGEGMWGAMLPFKYGNNYDFYKVPYYFYSRVMDFQGQGVYPASFNYLANVPIVNNVFNSTDRPSIIQGFAEGSLGAFNSWFGVEYLPVNEAMAAAQIINKTISMTDSATGQPRVFTGSPGTSFKYPLFMRVYFADTANNLQSSTKFCQQQYNTACFLSNLKQPTAALDLSTTPYYQIRYYDFAGGLVSNTGIARRLRQ